MDVGVDIEVALGFDLEQHSVSPCLHMISDGDIKIMCRLIQFHGDVEDGVANTVVDPTPNVGVRRRPAGISEARYRRCGQGE